MTGKEKSIEYNDTLPENWSVIDIGNSLKGGQKIINDSWHVYGGGNDIWNNNDQFRFIYKEQENDFTISISINEFETNWYTQQSGSRQPRGLVSASAARVTDWGGETMPINLYDPFRLNNRTQETGSGTTISADFSSLNAPSTTFAENASGTGSFVMKHILERPAIYTRNIAKFNNDSLIEDENISLNNLKLMKPDINKYPSIKILKKINNINSLFETVLISANDELVELYIKNKIKFLQINNILLKILNNKKYINLIKKKPKKISDIINLSEEVRLKTRNLCIQ